MAAEPGQPGARADRDAGCGQAAGGVGGGVPVGQHAQQDRAGPDRVAVFAPVDQGGDSARVDDLGQDDVTFYAGALGDGGAEGAQVGADGDGLQRAQLRLFCSVTLPGRYGRGFRCEEGSAIKVQRFGQGIGVVGGAEGAARRGVRGRVLGHVQQARAGQQYGVGENVAQLPVGADVERLPIAQDFGSGSYLAWAGRPGQALSPSAAVDAVAADDVDQRQPEIADELGAAPAHEVVAVAF